MNGSETTHQKPEDKAKKFENVSHQKKQGQV